MVWLPGTASTAWAALKAPDPGANTAAAHRDADDGHDGENGHREDDADTPDQAPLAPIGCGSPVRCRDKAILPPAMPA